jgi:hypothetical protein
MVNLEDIWYTVFSFGMLEQTELCLDLKVAATASWGLANKQY